MGYAICLALGLIFFLAIGMIRQSKNKKYLNELLKKQDGKKILYSIYQIENYNTDVYEFILANENDLSNDKSDLRRLMKTTGIQKLPCAFGLSKKGEINGEIINDANNGYKA